MSDTLWEAADLLWSAVRFIPRLAFGAVLVVIWLAGLAAPWVVVISLCESSAWFALLFPMCALVTAMWWRWTTGDSWFGELFDVVSR